MVAPLTLASVSRKMGGEEHIGVSGMDGVDGKSYLLHDFNSVQEREYNTLLCGTQQMAAVVQIEIDAVDRAAYVAVFKNTLSTVAEGQYGHAFATYGSLRCQRVHLVVGTSRGGHIPFHPRIEYAGAVYAGHYSDAGLLGRMVHVGEIVHTAERVIFNGVVYAVDNSGCSGRRCNFSGLENVER